MKNNEKIMLGHGSGGLMMKQLIEDVFFKEYGNKQLTSGDDAAILSNIDFGSNKKLAFSTDSYVVQPEFFSGGNIGKLAVCGTVNDVSTSGAKRIALSLSFIIEEGYPIDKLKRICASISKTAQEANIKIVTGDTKVVNKGSADKIFINTSGIGIIDDSINLSGSNCRPGDKVLLSGSIGDHGITIISEREGLNFSSDLKSDAAPLNGLIAECLDTCKDIRCFRDPTRGGIASTLNEFAEQSKVNIEVVESSVPVKDEVKAACDLLGYDVMQVANEGKILAVVPANHAKDVLDTMRSNIYGKDAAIIGEVRETQGSSAPEVFVKTAFGTKRILDMLVGEQLPRIC